ncbi:MAG: SDR family NAD(P)-dependent oxidoreductase [Chloroflexi bacterium]|nr:SDR family NAD(P)-dependent oxidoreductase [Chloroflexota bacterium]
MDLQLTGKRAIVTGGSRGIGKAIAFALAAEGVDLALVARSAGPLEQTAREVASKTGRKVIPLTGDTGDDASVKEFVQTAAKALGGIDILVNNAARPGGQGAVPTLSEITDAAFIEDMNVKVMGYLRCAREVAPLMSANGWGRIINISGMAARNSGSLIGSMRNVAVAAMTKNLADELGPSGINVTVVHPGLTRTEATAGVISARAAREGRSEQEVESQMALGNSVRRIISASDIANIVAFLASPLAVAISGDAIAAGGGVGRSIHY